MKNRWQVPHAIFRRELTSYFSNPTGYVFITLFVFLSAVAAFWQDDFFLNNLANLDPLNRFFPYLLVFFIPAITMSAWADEKRNGTDELLLTLPATDLDIVLGKYAAMLAIYTIALLFSLSHVIVLMFLGSPDFGLLAGTYLGYWLTGAAMLSLGMLGSLLTSNLTVAYILGALFSAVPVFIEHAGALFAGASERVLRGLSFVDHFQDFSAGVVPLSGALYFGCFTAAMLYLNVALLGRRHWPTTRGAPRLSLHYWARGLALVVAVASLTILAGRLGGRIDVTAEQIHSLSERTVGLIENLDPERPVFIHAYLSPEVPRRYLQTRNNIVSTLRQFDAIGGPRIHTRIVETDKYTDEATEAQDRYNIRPRPVPIFERVSGGPEEIFLGLAFLSGAEEFVIPFFDPGLPVEYELMRSIRVVAQADKRKVGVLKTGVEMFGGFDFQNRSRTTDWAIVSELRKQYDVVQVQANQDYPDDLDVLIAALPHTLAQNEVTRLSQYVWSGKPTLLLADPLPAFNIEMSPQQTPQSPFQRQPQAPKADVSGLMDVLGVEWPTERIAWDNYNPHPQFRSLPPEVVFISPQNERRQFNQEDPATSGLQEVVMLYGGVLEPKEGASTSFTPLVRTGVESGTTLWFRLVQSGIFGPQLATNLPHEPDDRTYVMAAYVTGGPNGPRPKEAPQSDEGTDEETDFRAERAEQDWGDSSEEEAEDEEAPASSGVNAIVIADVDVMGEQFFQLRAQGVENLNFDNVTFLLNAVDRLAGDTSFIELRKRRRRHRTLERVEEFTKQYEERRLEQTRDAEETSEEQLAEAQERLDAAVARLRERDDLDVRTKQIMIANQEKIENRRLAVARKNIEDEKNRLMERSRAEMEASIRGVQNRIKIAAVALSPIPAFALFLVVSARRLRREQASVSQDRLVREKKRG